MTKTLSSTKSKDIIANTISLIVGNDVLNLTDLFLLKNAAINDTIGLAPEDINTIAELAAALNNDSEFSKTKTHLLKLKDNIIDVDTQSSLKATWLDVYTNTN